MINEIAIFYDFIAIENNLCVALGSKKTTLTKVIQHKFLFIFYKKKYFSIKNYFYKNNYLL
jgi:hypothetical protein